MLYGTIYLQGFSAYFFDSITCLLVRVGYLSPTSLVLGFIYGFITCRIYFINFRTVLFCVYMLSDLLSDYSLNQYKMTFFIPSFFIRQHLHGFWGVFLVGNDKRKRPYFLIHNVSFLSFYWAIHTNNFQLLFKSIFYCCYVKHFKLIIWKFHTVCFEHFYPFSQLHSTLNYPAHFPIL